MIMMKNLYSATTINNILDIWDKSFPKYKCFLLLLVPITHGSEFHNTGAA